MKRNSYSGVFFPSGTKFNFLTVVKFSHYDKHKRKHYWVKCECGAEKSVQGTLLKSGNTKSCGCHGSRYRKNANRLPNNGGVVNHLILQYKRHAVRRGYSFDIGRAVFESLIRGDCYYCGSPPSNLKKTKNCRDGFKYNGIDRLNSNVGYVENNVVSCCGVCNRAKGSANSDEFIAWVKKVADQWG